MMEFIDVDKQSNLLLCELCGYSTHFVEEHSSDLGIRRMNAHVKTKRHMRLLTAQKERQSKKDDEEKEWNEMGAEIAFMKK